MRARRFPDRDCPVVIRGYMAEIRGYGRLCGSGRIADLVQMTSTFGIKPGASCARFYEHIRWADGREWTRRVDDPMAEIKDDASLAQAVRPLVDNPLQVYG